MRDAIVDIIEGCLKNLYEDMGLESSEEPSPQTRLYGAKSTIDSLGLVNLIVDLEEKVFEVLGKDILLADERALSQTRSPFRSVSSLAEYIELLLSESDSC